MIFGQSSFVYFNYPLHYAIESMGKMGYHAIEIWGGRPHYYHDDLDDELPALLKLLDKYQMTVPNFIPAQFRYPSLLCSLNEKVRKNSVLHITKTIDTALKFNAGSVSLCPGTALHGEDISKTWKSLKQSITEVLDYCSNKSLKVLIEPAHRWETNLIFTVADCVKMMGEIKSPQLGICFDTGHANVNGEDLYDAVMLASKYPMHIHIDDNMGEMDSHHIPGQGNIDFGKLKKALTDCRYNGCLSAELGFQYTMEPDAAVKESLQFLENNFGRE
jgi:fructoselysine 3-epimerase